MQRGAACLNSQVNQFILSQFQVVHFESLIINRFNWRTAGKYIVLIVYTSGTEYGQFNCWGSVLQCAGCCYNVIL